MASVWIILLSAAVGLSLATNAAAQRKTQDPVALAATHLKVGKYEAAEAELRKALAGGDRNPEAYRLLGLIYDETSRAKEQPKSFCRRCNSTRTHGKFRIV